MSNKNLIYMVAINHNTSTYKNTEYSGYSINTWKYWCEKNNVELFVYDTPSNSEHVDHKPTWQRWFDVFNQLDNSKINYDKIAVVDGSTMIKWDAPNFFEHTPNGKLSCFRSLENLRWITEGVDGYNNFFGGFEFKLNNYIDCGFQVFDIKHKKFLTKLEKFYNEHYDEIMDLQNNKVKRGTDQPVYNYLLQIENVDVVTDIPPSFMLSHLTRFDWFSHNWQLNKDKTPFFIKYGYIWKYSGFPQRGDRYNLMKQTWEAVKEMYK